MNLWAGRDPRAKTFFALAAGSALAIAPATRAWVALPAALALLLSAGIPTARLVSLLRGVALLWFLSMIANAFLWGGPRLGPEALGWARPSAEGLQSGFLHGARLGGLAALGAWLGETTAALDLARSLEWSVRNLPAIRRRVHRAVLPLVLALRLVPLLVEEARRLVEVERIRRGPVGRWTAMRRLARLSPLWMVLVVERAEALALALTLRGYDPERPRGFARRYRWAPPDWGLFALGVAALLGARR
jgi:energy-coupling factor transport system permease protein